MYLDRTRLSLTVQSPGRLGPGAEWSQVGISEWADGCKGGIKYERRKPRVGTFGPPPPPHCPGRNREPHDGTSIDYAEPRTGDDGGAGGPVG